MDANFRWFEGEKAQFRFVPYDWAFLFVRTASHPPPGPLKGEVDPAPLRLPEGGVRQAFRRGGLKQPRYPLREHADE